jgi:hypothetical protein
MKELTQEQTFLNRREVAELLRCSLGTIDNLVSQGKLKKLGYNRIVLFNKQEVIDDLKDEIKHLEFDLVKAKLNKDHITQLSINKRLDDAKSTLINIR